MKEEIRVHHLGEAFFLLTERAGAFAMFAHLRRATRRLSLITLLAACGGCAMTSVAHALYGTTNHGWPCFANDAMDAFFTELP